MPLLKIENLTKTYILDGKKIDAVSDISMDIEEGEFVSIVGHSGSGKTTLLSIIGGISNPTSGKVFYRETDIFQLDKDRLSEYRCEKIGFIFQFASLLPILTAKENLLVPVIFRSNHKPINHTEDESRAVNLLRMVGLEDKINAYPAQLSGGQQRRVAIARAFMNEPDLILADEPTGDLDEETEAEIIELFKIMNHEKKTTFIMITHNLELAKQAKRIIRMDHGKLKELH